MARILVVEPHEDVRSLLEIVISRLGHEPVVSHLREVKHAPLDAAVIEPGQGIGHALARGLRERGVPLVFSSIYPPTTELLALEPAAYLLKPFALYALERALSDALQAARSGCARAIG